MNLFKRIDFWVIVILIGIGAVVSFFLKGYILELGMWGHFVFSLLLGIIPGILWLYFFHLQDRYEPEPHQYLLGIFILGGLITYTVCIPLENYTKDIQLNFNLPEIQKWLIQLLIISSIQELIIFLTVRYSIYFHPQFNEPTDGVIYCISARLGFSAVYNILYVNSLEAINLSVVPIRVIEFYLINSVFSGTMGYFMGKARFHSRHFFHREILFIVGYLLAVILNGSYHYFSEVIQDISFSIWKSLFFSSALAILYYFFMYYLLQKSLQHSPFKTLNEK